ncbi:hypothetical protein JZO70_09080 [Enterococcus sp. 669A]|uniref:Uncharacterized protein n=1 Tax=Candidatus Enterococcus moelleringii TaxID=2815325 RepID=A0ABS3L9K5_9ENTE|nr:hypothetical protein [Enterococcus sp. 669A]MBO1306312.1 hypothetical protein [Enterococcus sp. 669A]
MDKEKLKGRVYLSPVISADELVEMINKRAAELGRVPEKEEFEFAQVVKIKYGSWRRCLSIIELDPKYSLSDEELLELVQAKAAEIGRTPERTEFEYGSLIRPRFGSWKKFVLQAGLEPPIPKPKITNEELIEQVQKQAAELGRTPTAPEFKNRKTAQKRFGSWNNFILSAGLKTNDRKLKITNEEFIERVQKQAQELGRTPLRSEFEKGDVAASRFGNWTNFLRSAGLEPKNPRLSNEELIARVQARAAELGRTPLKTEFFHNEAAINRFGSWANFLQSASLEHEGQYMSKKELVKRLKEQKAELGRTPHKAEFKHSSTADKRFGSWKAFLSYAGLGPKRLRNETLIKRVQEKAEQLGRSPKMKEFPLYRQAIKRFGSWTNFLETAGLEVRKVNRISNEELVAAIHEKVAELGRTPTQQEFDYGTLASSRYGTWYEFIKSVGLEPVRARNVFTNEELIEMVQQQAAELGYTPNGPEFKFGSMASQRFGSWAKFVESAGLEVRRTKNVMKNEELIELVHVIAEDLGRTPVREEFPYTSLTITRFGSWTKFLESAGLEQYTAKNRMKNEELIELVQARATELGHAPTKDEFAYTALAKTRYGTWNNFIESAGLEPNNPRYNLSETQLMELIQAQAKKLRRTPFRKEFKYSTYAVKKFGSWDEFIESAGLEKRKAMSGLSDKRLLRLVRAQAKDEGRVPTKRSFPYGAMAASRYGSWSNFLKAAGLKTWKHGPVISNEELIEGVQAMAAELGRIPTNKEFKQKHTAVSRYGSWNEFLCQAGLKPKRSETTLSNEKLISLIQELAAKLGHVPSAEEFLHTKGATYRFGGWIKFLQEAGFDLSKFDRRLSNQELIELVQLKAAELGRSPIVREFQYGQMAASRYGTWGKFMESAGLKSFKARLSYSELIELLLERTAELGRVPKKEEFEFSKRAINKFGSWNTFLVDAGLEGEQTKPTSNNNPLDLWFL